MHDRADVPARLGGVTYSVCIVDVDRARCWFCEGCRDSEQCGFARTVFTQYRYDLTGIQGERQVIENGCRAVSFGEGVDLQRRLARLVGDLHLSGCDGDLPDVGVQSGVVDSDVRF